ncbi:MAG: hypothetical protein QOH98_1559, partial [Methylobacteriaceae bacterium]|nr:hypothetical protein [Methylobacteriaceae bacterium]
MSLSSGILLRSGAPAASGRASMLEPVA